MKDLLQKHKGTSPSLLIKPIPLAESYIGPTIYSMIRTLIFCIEVFQGKNMKRLKPSFVDIVLVILASVSFADNLDENFKAANAGD